MDSAYLTKMAKSISKNKKDKEKLRMIGRKLKKKFMSVHNDSKSIEHMISKYKKEHLEKDGDMIKCKAMMRRVMTAMKDAKDKVDKKRMKTTMEKLEKMMKMSSKDKKKLAKKIEEKMKDHKKVEEMKRKLMQLYKHVS